MTILSGETFSLTYIIQHAQSAVSLQHTHTRSRKCSLINTPLSGIPADLADPFPIWAEHLHNPFEREKYGGLLGDISFPPRQQVLCVHGYWILQTIYYPSVWGVDLNCKCLHPPANSSWGGEGPPFCSQRYFWQTWENDFRQCCRESAAGTVMWLYSLQKIHCEYEQLRRSGNQPVCLDKRPVSQNYGAVKTGLNNMLFLGWFSIKCGLLLLSCIDW